MLAALPVSQSSQDRLAYWQNGAKEALWPALARAVQASMDIFLEVRGKASAGGLSKIDLSSSRESLAAVEEPLFDSLYAFRSALLAAYGKETPAPIRSFIHEAPGFVPLQRFFLDELDRALEKGEDLAPVLERWSWDVVTEGSPCSLRELEDALDRSFGRGAMRSPCGVREMCGRAFSKAVSCLPPSERGSIQFSAEISAQPASLPATMELILEELTRNAARFVPKDGSGSIQVRLDSQSDRMTLTVSDNGPGVPEHLRAKIFEHGFSTRAGGTGQGLAILKDEIDSLGGSLELIPGTRGGATFQIELPCREPEPAGA